MLYWQIDPTRVAESLGSRAQHFLDGGGRYALSIGLTLLVIALWRKIAPRQPSPADRPWPERAMFLPTQNASIVIFACEYVGMGR